MPEWSNGAVSKTVVLLAGTEGSNPSLSANRACELSEAKPRSPAAERLRVIYLFGRVESLLQLWQFSFLLHISTYFTDIVEPYAVGRIRGVAAYGIDGG